MKLKEYISWTNSIDEYKDSASLAKLDTWGYEVLPGSVRLPKLNLENAVKGDEGYDSVRNDLITNWAKVTWPFLTCIDAKIQIQRPGEECKPHLDFLGDYLEKVCVETVESGLMTKDLAILINKSTKYLTTNQFLDALDSNFKKKLN